MAAARDTDIFHLATLDEWATAQAYGTVTATVATEGFVHCSTPGQLAGTIARHFAGVDRLVLLRLDAGALGESLVWEEGRPGEVFPHLYRPIAVAEVLEALPWRRGETALPT
jgi:uncharacterized protein (DUF952 family)